SISVAGMTVAFPAGIGMAIVMSSLLGFIIKPASNLMLLLAGCALIAAAVVVVANAYNIMGVLRHEQLARAGKTRSTRRPTTVKGVILALVGGLLLGSFFPMMQKATETEIGLGPYAVMVVFSAGVFLSTPMFDIFFINLPVEGEPLEITEFLHVRPGLHLLGVLGGAIWCTGSVASLTTGLAPVPARLPVPLNSLLSQGYPLIAVLWGLFAWKEFRSGDGRVKLLTLTMFVLFAGGLALIAIAPLYAHRS
ncbi:MAG TPA: hypothetical protein VGS58_05345, partial [Candidatus Sulfopaludibacter sp.]|nr:hypothetical protein [Candidatus Sulfopaludibacter sp.]